MLLVHHQSGGGLNDNSGESGSLGAFESVWSDLDSNKGGVGGYKGDHGSGGGGGWVAQVFGWWRREVDVPEGAVISFFLGTVAPFGRVLLVVLDNVVGS